MYVQGSFEENGYRLEAHAPDGDSDPIAWEVRILVDNVLKKSLFVPMTYAPVFGVDLDDQRCLNEFADRMMEILPEANQFDDQAVIALEKLEQEYGGDRVRQSMLRADRRESTSPGQFEHTRNLFIGRFEELLGGREAAEQWMKTKVAELEDRTPEEALRMGMAPEVLNYLGKIGSRS